MKLPRKIQHWLAKSIQNLVKRIYCEHWVSLTFHFKFKVIRCLEDYNWPCSFGWKFYLDQVLKLWSQRSGSRGMFLMWNGFASLFQTQMTTETVLFLNCFIACISLPFLLGFCNGLYLAWLLKSVNCYLSHISCVFWERSAF